MIGDPQFGNRLFRGASGLVQRETARLLSEN